jgi:glycosyltransferase involved in cell wall biosynthesis
MKISFFDPFSMDFGGGVERWIYAISQRLSARGHKIRIISLKFAPELNWRISKTMSHSAYSGMPYTRLPKGAPFPSVLSVNALIKQFNDSDVVYFFPYPPNELVLYVLKRKLGLLHARFIGGVHGFLRQDITIERLYSYILKYSLRAFDAVHVLNTYTLLLLKRWGYQNTYLVPNGIDTFAFTLCQPEMSSFKILFTGIHNKNKGIDILAEIIRRFNESDFKHVRFVISGGGEYASIVKGLAEKYNNVEYVGYVPSYLLPSVYKNAHVFFAPSRLEGMPLRVLEAQSCGLPVVASNIPGIRDIVIHGKTGSLGKVDDVQGFIAMLKQYYCLWKDSPKQFRMMNEEIRTYVVKNYDWNVVLDRFENILRNVYLKRKKDSHMPRYV